MPSTGKPRDELNSLKADVEKAIDATKHAALESEPRKVAVNVRPAKKPSK